MKTRIECEVCGKEFFKNASQMKYENPRFCSLSCYKSTRTSDVVERFWKYVHKTDDCWNWTGGLLRGGYGSFTNKTKYISAHRFSYFLHKGEIPKGLLVCHSCDNRKCVNPSHIWLGSHQDNADDAVRKGRVPRGDDSPARRHPQSIKRGEASGMSKLTEKDVREIRELAKTHYRKDIAKIYGVSKQSICSIVLRQTWAHIE